MGKAVNYKFAGQYHVHVITHFVLNLIKPNKIILGVQPISKHSQDK